MAKMTLGELQTFVKTYVESAAQGGAYVPTTNNLVGLVDKIGRIVTISDTFSDPLNGRLEGQDLDYGFTIEEWYANLAAPQDYDPTGANTLAPHNLTFEDCAYSTTLGRKTIAISKKYDDIERACTNANDAANITAKIMQRLTDSYQMYCFAIKKQLLGNVVDKADAADLSQVVAKPVDTTTGEAFIKAVKNEIEKSKFPTENTSLSKTLIAPVPRLTLYIKKGIESVLSVDVNAGAFNPSQLGLDCDVIVVDDFGKNGVAGAYAMLVDERGIKLHKDYEALRDQVNAEGDYINFFQHSEHTAYISKFTYMEVFKEA